MNYAEVNKAKIFHGVFKQNAVAPSVDDEDAEHREEAAGGSKKKRLKSKDTHWSKRQKFDPNAPSYSRIPLPEMSDSWKVAKSRANSEIAKRVKLGPEKLPSICFYNLLNTNSGVCCCEISEDSSILCAGFNNSTVQVWSLDDSKLKPLKKSADLEKLDREADDIMENILDEANSTSRLTFVGHNGPVYNTSINFDKKLILSCSEDSTVRLWSLQTWTNLVVYRLNDMPFFDVEFGPFGYYFATAGSDKCALLWTLDRQQPLRMFVGHDSDVNCLNFHPNSNYLASGSDDRTIKMWDLAGGECVRHFADITAPIQTVKFSHDGCLLAAGSKKNSIFTNMFNLFSTSKILSCKYCICRTVISAVDGHVLLYDVGQGRLLCDLPAVHEKQPVYTLAFSRDNSVLASGGSDNKVSLHHLSPLHSEVATDGGVNFKPMVPDSLHMADFYTKSTPVMHLHFTRRNLLLGAGSFGQM